VQLVRTSVFEDTLQDLRALYLDVTAFNNAMASTIAALTADPMSGDLTGASETTVYRATRAPVVPPCYVVHRFVAPDQLVLERVVEASQLDTYRQGLESLLHHREEQLSQAAVSPHELDRLEAMLLKTRELTIEDRPAPAMTTKEITLLLDHIARRRAASAR
jgi:hypothetical protein